MPIYEFRCNHCGHRFERLQKMSDPDPDRCPACGKQGGVTHLISPVGFRLKGGGWYETDFKSGNRHNVADDGGGKKKSQTSSDGETPKKSGKSEKVEKSSKSATASGTGEAT